MVGKSNETTAKHTTIICEHLLSQPTNQRSCRLTTANQIEEKNTCEEEEEEEKCGVNEQTMCLGDR